MKKVLTIALLVIVTWAFAQIKTPAKGDTSKKMHEPASYAANPNQVYTVLLTGTARQLAEMSFAVNAGIPQIDRTDYNLKMRDQAKADAGDLNKQLLSGIDAALKSDRQKFISDSLKAARKK